MFEVKRGRAIEVKEVSNSGTLVGYGSTFNEVDLGYDVIEPGAFAKSLDERGLPKMLWGHDFMEPPIGNWTKAEEDKRGLYLEGRLNLDMQKARDVHSALKNKSVDGLSVGFIPVEDEIAKSGVRFIKEAQLYEVSVVNFPMNESARVDAVKTLISSGKITKAQLETILRDAGLSRAQAKALIAEGYDGLIQRDAGDDVDLGGHIARLSSILTTTR